MVLQELCDLQELEQNILRAIGECDNNIYWGRKTIRENEEVKAALLKDLEHIKDTMEAL